jgi:hypothetical protein
LYTKTGEPFSVSSTDLEFRSRNSNCPNPAVGTTITAIKEIISDFIFSPCLVRFRQFTRFLPAEPGCEPERAELCWK